MRIVLTFKLIFLAICFLGISEIVYSKSIPGIESSVAPDTDVVGGWYPVFFDNYSENKVNQIITTINEGRATKVVISFDQNKSLAVKIKTAIENKTHFKTELIHVSNKDDNTVQYNHTLVVVTVWTSRIS